MFKQDFVLFAISFPLRCWWFSTFLVIIYYYCYFWRSKTLALASVVLLNVITVIIIIIAIIIMLDRIYERQADIPAIRWNIITTQSVISTCIGASFSINQTPDLCDFYHSSSNDIAISVMVVGRLAVSLLNL